MIIKYRMGGTYGFVEAYDLRYLPIFPHYILLKSMRKKRFLVVKVVNCDLL